MWDTQLQQCSRSKPVGCLVCLHIFQPAAGEISSLYIIKVAIFYTILKFLQQRFSIFPRGRKLPGHIKHCRYKTLIWKVQRRQPSSFLVYHHLGVLSCLKSWRKGPCLHQLRNVYPARCFPWAVSVCLLYSRSSPHTQPPVSSFSFSVWLREGSLPWRSIWESRGSDANPSGTPLALLRGGDGSYFGLPWICGHRPMPLSTPSMHDGSGTCCQPTFTI